MEFIYMAAPAVVLLVLALIVAFMFRRVVPTNMVHIVQSSKKTTSYGTGLGSNVYYAWPTSIPKFGVSVIKLPVSNFDLSLQNYEAYDEDRVPFVVDVTAFFRVADTDAAAQRAENFDELKQQLTEIVRGAVRKVLASDKIDQIMLDRAKFGTSFTEEVEEQLNEWGVVPVKSMELMDIRDSKDSAVITNIMAMKTSNIEMESRKEVAANKRAAEVAEVEAQREIDVQKEEAERVVGEKRAERAKLVGIADEQAKQEVAVQNKVTRAKELEVTKVEEVTTAQIVKEKEIVKAEEQAETAVVKAEGDKKKQVLTAEGELEAEKLKAQGIKAVGDAEASAEAAMQMAPVTAQIALAQEIGENPGYQTYLVSIEEVKANERVGIENAQALRAADIKVISNGSTASDGMTGVAGLLSSTGGTNVAAMLEGLNQSEIGDQLLTRLGLKPKEEEPKSPTGPVLITEITAGDPEEEIPF